MRPGVLVAVVVLGASGFVQVEQEPRRPTGRMIPGPTYTPTATATPTPEPDPCSACPDPDSLACRLWPEICYRCWTDCGHPIATPTPTPTATRTPTPTPHGPACELTMPYGGAVYLVAYYAHESEQRGVRYTYQTGPVTVSPGAIARPCPCEGHPIGFRWYTIGANGYVLLKSCGDTSAVYPPTPTPTPGPVTIFADGFETGDTSRWSQTTGGE